MEIADVLKDFKDQPTYIIERRLNELLRENSRFFNLDERNRKLVFDLIKKYKEDIRKGVGINAEKIHRETYNLYQNRLKYNLTEEDLKDIKEILEFFKS